MASRFGDKAAPEVWVGGPKTLTLVRDGGVQPKLLLRRITPSYANDIQLAANVVRGGLAEMHKYQEMLVRWAIVGATNLTDADSQEPAEFSVEDSPVGPIASRCVYDSLCDLDSDAILAVSRHRISVAVVETLLAEAWVKVRNGKSDAQRAYENLQQALAEHLDANKEQIEGKSQPPPNGFIGGGSTPASDSGQPIAASD